MMERDVIKNSKYIISYFNSKSEEVTNLKLQKLLYFLEAIYMVVTDENYLYEEEFYAWNFGPVNDLVYREYKEFGSLPIEIEEIAIPAENEIFISSLFKIFHNYSAYDLVELSHSKGSPWYEIYEKYQDDIIPNNIVIEKSKTKKWFGEITDVN